MDILHESILRGLTGTLTAGRTDAAGHAIHLMQGEIVGAEGPDDDIWLVRRLTAQGAITERQGVAFTRSIERSGKLDAHLLDELPAPLHVALRAGRFRQNVLEFLRSDEPVRFERERTMFRDHAEVEHDSGDLLSEMAALQAHVAGLQQQVHDGHRLRVGPAGPADADEARLLDLVDPAMSLHDLVTFSPFEEGRTLALVRDMLESGALRSDTPIKLTATPPGPGSSPDRQHDHESLFSAGSSVDDLVEIAVEGPARHDPVLGRMSASRQLVSGFGDLSQFAAADAEDGDWGDDVPGDYGGLAAEAAPAPLAVEDVFDDALFEELAEETVAEQAAPPPAEAAPVAAVAAEPPPSDEDAPAEDEEAPAEDEEPSLQDLMAQAARTADADAGLRALLQPPPLQTPTVAPVREEALVEEAPSEDFPPLDADLAAALAEAEADLDDVAPAVDDEDDDEADEATRPMLRPQRAAPDHVEDLFDLGEGVEEYDEYEDERTEEVPRSPTPVRNLRAPEEPRPARPPEPSLSELDTAEAMPLPGELPAQMVETLFEEASSALQEPVSAPAAFPVDALPAFEAGPVEEEPVDEAPLAAAPIEEALEAAPLDEAALEPLPDEALEAEPLDALADADIEDAPLGAREAEAIEDAPLGALEAEAIEDAPLGALEADDIEDAPLGALEADDIEDADDAPATDGTADFSEQESTEDLLPAADEDDAPSPEMAAALRRAEEAASRREAAREVAEYDEDDLLVSHPPRTDLFDFGDDLEDDEMAMFQDHDRFRGGGQGQFTLSHNLLDHVDLNEGGPESGNLPPPVEFPAGFGAPAPAFAEDGDDDGMLEMGDAESASLTDADKVVALNFSAPRLELAEMDKKLRVATDVLSRISGALDGRLGPGAGQASIQLLLDGAPSAYAVVFQGLHARIDGTFDVSAAARNIQRRPEGEHRRLIDNGTMDLIERGLSYAVAELDDDAMDALLEGIAGYQQRLRS